MIQNAKIVSVGVQPKDYLGQKAERGSPKYIMSASGLKLFAGCPRRWIKGYELPASDAKEFGSLVDCLLTTPEQFKSIYAVHPNEYENDKGEMKKWNGNATVCKEWKADAEGRGLESVSASDFSEAETAIARLREDEVIAKYLDDSDKQVQLSAEWHDKKTGLVIPLRGLIDFVPRKDSEFADTLGDLKTTRNAGLLAWQRWAFQVGYHIQAALYLSIYNQAMNEERNTFCFLLVENFVPWEPAKRMLSQDFLDLGKIEYERILSNYCACLKHNHFPSYDETDEAIQGWGMCSLEPFQAERAMFAPRYDFETETETNNEPNLNEVPMP